MGPLRRAVPAAVLLLLATASSAVAAPPSVTLRRDAQGTPHVIAKDWRGLGYGFAQVHAEDNLCVLADIYLTTDGERSRFLGPDATYPIRNTGTTPSNINSDFFWSQVKASQHVEKLAAEPPPSGPEPEIKEVIAGYVEGYNDHLKAIGGPDGVEDPACKGQPWVRPIDAGDVYRRFFQLSELASAMAAVDGLGSAQPPTPDLMPAVSATAAARAVPPGEVDRHLVEHGVGSNAIALGGAATKDGRGLLLGNPHQPWLGGERFFQWHGTIKGKIDVSGGSLYGSPAVNIGFNKDLAWSHTVSTARRFAIVQETLVPGSPTTYLVDGKPREMTKTKVTVQALVDGKLEPRTRTLYETVHGPVTSGIIGLPIFPWTPVTAFALNDSNRENFGRLLNHFFNVDRAGSVDELKGILRKYQGVPWVTTIAADRSGKALFSDVSSVPGVTNELQARCSTALGTTLFALQRVIVLDGTRGDCSPQTGPGAAGKGILGPDQQPQLERDDYVTNSNDSYWASNPRKLLTGFPQIHGDEGTERSLRTRDGVQMVEDGLAGGGTFTPASLRGLMLSNRQQAWALWKDDLLRLCDEAGPAEACAAFRKYTGFDDLDVPGALLFRRFVAHALDAVPSPFAVPFDAKDPIGTPRGLDTSNLMVRAALGQAVSDLQGLGAPLDAPLRGYQADTSHGAPIPLTGGPQSLGLFNHIGLTWDPARGYLGVPSEGATYVQEVGFAAGQACPVQASTLIGHSQSTDRTSPWFSNGTQRLGRKEWTEQPFCSADVVARTKVEARYGGGGEAALVRGLRVRRSGGRVVVRYRLSERARVVVRVLRGKGSAGAGRAVATQSAGARRLVVRAPRGTRVVVRAAADGRATSLRARVPGKARR